MSNNSGVSKYSGIINRRNKTPHPKKTQQGKKQKNPNNPNLSRKGFTEALLTAYRSQQFSPFFPLIFFCIIPGKIQSNNNRKHSSFAEIVHNKTVKPIKKIVSWKKGHRSKTILNGRSRFQPWSGKELWCVHKRSVCTEKMASEKKCSN